MALRHPLRQLHQPWPVDEARDEQLAAQVDRRSNGSLQRGEATVDEDAGDEERDGPGQERPHSRDPHLWPRVADRVAVVAGRVGAIIACPKPGDLRSA